MEIISHCDNDITSERTFLDNLGFSFDRVSRDKTVNENGNRLLDFCKTYQLRIANGRVCSDRDVGDYTFCGRQGQSTIDYFVAPIDIFSLINQFTVSKVSEFSDHCFLHLVLKLDNVSCQYVHSGEFKDRYKWKDHKCNDYLNYLQDDHTSGILDSLETVLSDVNIDKNEIDKCVMSITELLQRAGSGHVTSPGARAPRGKDWFDDECRTLRAAFKQAEAIFRSSGDDCDRINMVDCRSAYRRCCRNKAKFNNKSYAKKLSVLSKTNVKQFWKEIGKRNKRSHGVGNCNFEEYFKKLSNPDVIPEVDESVLGETELDNVQRWVEELDVDITQSEVITAVKSLKMEKSAGFDGVLNEFLVHGSFIQIPVLTRLFNAIIRTGYFPSEWTKGVIVPVHKKGSKSIPDNYRGVTLHSCVSKLFTRVLNSRIASWCDKYSVLIEEQSGFRENYSTVDCIFVLHGLINMAIKNKVKLYCAFVDYRKAFDFINRQALWLKLYKLGVSSQFLKLLRSMYEEVKSCVRLSGNIYSSFFVSSIGVRQGENLSPILFSLFINDIVDELASVKDLGILVSNIRLLLLLFADDMVLFSNSVKGLQDGLDMLHEYCAKWGLTINTDKTKVVIFRKGGRGMKSGFIMDHCLMWLVSSNI